MTKREMLEKLMGVNDLNTEVTYNECKGLTIFMGIPADLCEVVANNVGTYNAYRAHNWETDKAAVLTLASTAGKDLEDIAFRFTGDNHGTISADDIRELLCVSVLGIDVAHVKSVRDLDKLVVKYSEFLASIGFVNENSDCSLSTSICLGRFNDCKLVKEKVDAHIKALDRPTRYNHRNVLQRYGYPVNNKDMKQCRRDLKSLLE